MHDDRKLPRATTLGGGPRACLFRSQVSLSYKTRPQQTLESLGVCYFTALLTQF